MAEAKRGKSSNGFFDAVEKRVKASGELIEKVISFLPIKRTVQLGLLATRFRYSWCQSRNFSFDMDFARGRNKDDLIRIINQAFESHLGPKIQRLSLYIDPTGFQDLLNSWIRKATDKGLEDLDLDFSETEFPCIIDFSLLDIKTLRTLRLINCTIDVPPELEGLRFLKSLCLHKVNVDEFLLIRKLFSNCLLLERLKLVSCSVYCNNVLAQNLNVIAPNLKNFKVLIVEHCHGLSSINIDARTLCSLHCHGEFCNISLNSTLPQLEDVILDYAPTQGFQNVTQVKKLVTDLTSVNVLTVTSTFLEVSLFS